MKGAQRRGIACHQEAAAGIPVQAVRQLERLAGLEGPQGLDDSEADAAAAVHCDARRLVEDEEPVRLLDDRPPHRLHHRRWGPARCPRRALLSLLPDRRHPDTIVEAQARIRAGPAPVHPHLSAANDAEYPGPWHIAQAAGQVLVEALAGIPLLDLEMPHAMAPAPVCGGQAIQRAVGFTPGSPGFVLWHVDPQCKALFLQ